MSSPTAAPELILDAWPVLEWIKGNEPARTAFHSIVEDAFAHRVGLLMSRINHGEVVYSIRKTFPRDRVVAALKGFAEIPIRLYSVDDALVDEAVNLKSIYPVSYADAFAIALSVRMQVPLVTGDPEISRISLADLKIHWIGK